MKENEYTTEVLIADLLVRLSALETLLISKNIITQQELKELTTDFTQKISQRILEKANSSANLEDFITTLK